MNGARHKVERLTDSEQDHLLREYRMLPRTPKGQVQKGFTDLLCRKWGVSKGQLHKMLHGGGIADAAV